MLSFRWVSHLQFVLNIASIYTHYKSEMLPIETAHIDKYKELKSLMSWKFQSFKKVKFLGV